MALNDSDHTKNQVNSLQTNGICEHFHKTILGDFYEIIFRKKPYPDMGSLQQELDNWLKYYNGQRTHQGKMCRDRTSLPRWKTGKKSRRKNS